MKKILLAAMLLALPVSDFVVTTAQAQGKGRHDEGRQRTRGGSAATEAEEVRFPNATRTEPARRTGERTMRQIVTAFDAMNADNNERARTTFESLKGNRALTDYERSLVHQGLGQIAYESEDLDGAIAEWNQALAANGLGNNDHYRLLYQIAQLQMSEEQYAQALLTLDRYMTETRDAGHEPQALMGNALYRMERYDEAVAALDRAIAIKADDPTLFELKMASLYEKEDYNGAARVLEEMVRRWPDEPKHRINLAQMYIQADNYDRALEILQTAQREGRLTQADHWRQLYQLLSYADQPGEAAAAIEQGLAAGTLPADAATLRALGDNLYRAEQVDKAILAYGRAAEQTADSGQLDQQRGHLLVEQERYAEAKEALTRALAKGNLDDEGMAYVLLGEAEQGLGNTAAARTAFQRAQASGSETARGHARIRLQNL
ncbi:MAG: tetratricopeptide repeat protein [Xanthomonadales bacterium]|nr:tetratricopeptide repeat protein [Xanthomonadales bacterium]